jgi:hypothetical protein
MTKSDISAARNILKNGKTKQISVSDADNAITVQKHSNMLTSITEFKASGAFYGDQSGSRSKSGASATEDDMS